MAGASRVVVVLCWSTRAADLRLAKRILLRRLRLSRGWNISDPGSIVTLAPSCSITFPPRPAKRIFNPFKSSRVNGFSKPAGGFRSGHAAEDWMNVEFV